MPSLKELIKRLIKSEKKIATVVSFPKSGRTWVRVMLDDLEIRAAYTHAGSEYTSDRHFSELPNPSAIRTLKNVLFLFRDPRDTVVSGYFQKIKRTDSQLVCSDLSDFIRDPRYGVEKVVRFNLAWLNSQNHPQKREIKAISYEALRQNPIAGMTAIYTYLIGRPPSRPDLIESVVQSASFSRMQALERSGELGSKYGKILTPGNQNDPESFKVRKGKIGGFTDYLTAEDIDFCSKLMAQHQYSERLSQVSSMMLDFA